MPIHGDLKAFELTEHLEKPSVWSNTWIVMQQNQVVSRSAPTNRIPSYKIY